MIIFALFIAGMIALLAYGIYDAARGNKKFLEWTKDPLCPRCSFKVLTVFEQKDDDESKEPWKCPVCGFQEAPYEGYLKRLFRKTQNDPIPILPDRNFNDALDDDGITPVERLIRENGTDQ